MKKYLVIAIISIAALLMIAITKNMYNNTPTINAEYVTRKTAVGQLRVSGVIEYSDSMSQSAEGSGAVKAVAGKIGSTVSEGDIVMYVYEINEDVDVNSIINSNEEADNIINEYKDKMIIKSYTAPKSGRITAINCAEGEIYLSGQDLFTIAAEDKFRASMNVSEKDISKVSVNQKALITCPALADTMTAFVKTIGNTASRGSLQSDKPASVKVTAEIEGENGLRPGYTADCRIITEVKENTLMITPNSYRIDDNGEASVYVVDGETGKRERRRITVGTTYANGTEVINGLNEGEMIAVNYSEGEL